MASHPPKLTVSFCGKERLQKLKTACQEKYGESPRFFAFAPGRVNLIGEHIDYCGYAVLPMAIEQNILAAVAVNGSKMIHLTNTNGKYQDFAVSSDSIAIDRNNPQWYYYFLCGVKGIQDHLGLSSLPGLCCVVDGTVPASAGLSSSSALVCCAGLLTMEASNAALTKRELAELCARCERYIGVEGGGMDQSISFLAEEGTAKLIEFNPVRATDVKLPDGAVFVIANSCVEMNKAASAHYNIRVVECRMAAKVLVKAGGLSWECVQLLKEAQEKLGLGLEEALERVEEVLHKHPYTRDEVCGILGISQQELANNILSANTQHVMEFKLYQRARHVFGEAARVHRFKSVCDASGSMRVETLQQLGNLMNESHQSCRDLYECSCPQLDQLVNICRESGALGSRLTGAGWGGCTVSLVPIEKADAFLKMVRERYYLADPRLAPLEQQSLFLTRPGGGAAVLKEDQ